MRPDTLLIVCVVLLGFGFLWHLIETLNQRLAGMINTAQDAIDALKTRVERLTTIEEGVKTTLSALNAKLKDVQDELAARGITPEQLTSLSDLITELDTHEDGIVGAITANTGGDPGASTGDPGNPAAGVPDETPATTDTPLSPPDGAEAPLPPEEAPAEPATAEETPADA